MAKDEDKQALKISVNPPDSDRVSYESLLNFNFYKTGSPFFGSFKGMRYLLVKDKDESEKDRLALSLWPEPLAYEAVAKEEIRQFFFEFSEEGRRAAVDRINSEYLKDQSLWRDAEENGLRRVMRSGV